MEERETWTARFLRSDREIGQTDFDGTFLRGTLPITQVFGSAVTGVCPRQANVHASTKSDIKLESLILAQNERWRQA